MKLEEKKRNFPINHLKIQLSCLLFLLYRCCLSSFPRLIWPHLFLNLRWGAERERDNVYWIKSLTCWWCSDKYLRRGISGHSTSRCELLALSHTVYYKQTAVAHGASKRTCLRKLSPVVWMNCYMEVGLWEVKSCNYTISAQTRITKTRAVILKSVLSYLISK